MLPFASLGTGHRYDPQSCFIERDATKANVRYFVSRNEVTKKSADLYKSVDGGSTWVPTTHPFGLDVWVWSLHADPIRTDNLWAAGEYGGVKVSRDGGQTWSVPKTSSGTENYFDARFVSSCNGKIAVFGKKGGSPNPNLLWYSDDDGVSWTAQTSVEKNFHGVQGITVDRNGKIWVSWNSVTVVTPASMVTANEIATLENATSLFPNPTQGLVSLSIDNDVTGLHTISIFDLAGKKMATISVNKVENHMELPLDFTDYPAGVYVVETVNMNSRSVKKVSKF